MIEAFFTAVLLGAGAVIGIDLAKRCITKFTDPAEKAKVKKKIKKFFDED